MDEFSANYSDLKLTIRFYHNLNYDWQLSIHSFSTKTIKELKKGTVAIYALEIVSSHSEQTQEHFWPCLIFNSDPKLAKDELVEFLEESEILEKLEDYWNVVLEENGPEWKLP